MKRLFKRRLLLALILVIALAWAAAGAVFAFDRPLRTQVEQQVARDLHTSVPFEDTPVVSIAGYPFVWHALTKRFPSVTVRSAGMPIEVQGARPVLRQVEFVLTDVTYTPDETRAAHAAGHATLAWNDLKGLAQAKAVSFAGPDHVRAEYEAEVWGFPVQAIVTGTPALDTGAQTITLGDPEIKVSGLSLGKTVSDTLVKTLVKPVALPLPYGLRVERVSPGIDGVRVDVAGDDVAFPSR